MNSSIRRRLSLWLSPILLLTGFGAAALTRFNVQKEIDELFDKVLRTMAYSLPNSAAPVQRPPPRRSLPPKLSDLDLISQIWSPEGHLRYRSHPFPPLPYANIEGWSTVEWRGEAWRVFGLKTADGLIQIAQSQNERTETAEEIAIDLLLPLLVLVPGLPVLIWFGIGRGLRPLRDITRIVEKRSPDSLEPIPDHALPDEVATLVTALNGLLLRLGEALATQRKFTADAAHELRTPLTALSLQAQVAEGAPNPQKKALALQALRGGIARANHLVEQLLTLARLDPEAVQSALEPLPLDELARVVVADYVAPATRKNIDLGIGSAEPVLVPGDKEALRVLLGNLIDNAIRYTPPGGRVSVSIRTDGNRVRLEVEDNGPGIAPEERERVFDRFYRGLGNSEPGSGLGLSIVKRIADRHGVTVQFADAESGSGLKVSLTFPAHP